MFGPVAPMAPALLHDLQTFVTLKSQYSYKYKCPSLFLNSTTTQQQLILIL